MICEFIGKRTSSETQVVKKSKLDTANYESIGKLISSLEMDTGAINLFNSENNFITKLDNNALIKYRKHYESLHLFLIDWENETYEREKDRKIELWEYGLIGLPYPDLLIDFPILQLFENGNPYKPIVRITKIENPQNYSYEIQNIPANHLWYCEILNKGDNNSLEFGSFIIAFDKEYKNYVCLPSLWNEDIKGIQPVNNMISVFYPATDFSEEIRYLLNSWSDIIIKTILHIKHPQRVIMLEKPILTKHEQRFKEKALKPWFQKKPRHIIMDKSKFKIYYKEHNHTGRGAGVKKAPHPRIAHFCFLQSERYKNKRYQLIPRKSAKVNMESCQWESSKTIYSVIN